MLERSWLEADCSSVCSLLYLFAKPQDSSRHFFPPFQHEMWLYVCVSRRETFRGRRYHSDCLEDFFWFLRKVRWQFDRRRRGGGAKPLIPTDDKRAHLLYAFWVLLPCLMFRPSPSGSCKYVWNVQSSGLSRSVQSTVGSRTHPPDPQWVMRQWFVGVCEACVICKGKRGRVPN